MAANAFGATEMMALAQMVLTRDFQGPVRAATAHELLVQARLALSRGEPALAADLADLAARLLAPPESGEGLGIRSAATDRHGRVAAELMAGGGAPAPGPAVASGLAALGLRERGVVLRPAGIPNPGSPRLASDGTPRGLPRSLPV